VSGTEVDVSAARELERHLVRARIAGDVLTPRESNLDHARRLAAGERGFLFGLPPREAWSYERVAALMVERVGIDPDLTRETGPDTIDPVLTRVALDRVRDRLARAAAGRERVLIASGHPTGILDIHLGLAEALRRAGCAVLTPGAGAVYDVAGGYADRSRRLQIRYLAGVAVATDGANLWHSHAPEGMVAMLAALAADGGAAPDLVIADHGFAGAAAAAGLDVASFADSNDPALFVGEAEGRVAITVPLDDNVLSHLYRPVVSYLLAGWAD
jgi:hypothetical protein